MRLTVVTPGERREIPFAEEDRGVPLSEFLRRKNLPLNTRCGQRGRCDGCLVDLLHPGGREQARACEHALDPSQPLHIRVPERSLLARDPQSAIDFQINVPRAHAPLADSGIGLALDIGTTTVALLAVDLATGETRGRVSGFNRQMSQGDDVLTRIQLCFGSPDRLKELQRAIVGETLAPLIRKLLEETKSSPADIRGAVVAGNTTMLHLFVGADPSPMGVVPFRPAFLERRPMNASEAGLPLDCPLHLLPGASAYVGADICAGVFATGLAYDDGPSLLVDVGTNGEIVLKSRDRLRGCATAAGPAFEGSGLTCGVRATRGAVESIRFVNGRPRAGVIGRSEPYGFCGSAYVDFLAEGRRNQLLTTSGRFDPARHPCGAWKFDGGLSITEADIAALLQAKAAVAAGILTLLSQADVKPSEIKRVYLAGGFGMHLRVANAIACGLLPGFRTDQIQVVGNTALAGAYLAALDRGALEEMSTIARSIEVVELNLDPEFENRYIDQLALP